MAVAEDNPIIVIAQDTDLMAVAEDNPKQSTLSELDPRLIFTRFGKLARQREILYSDFIEIDEPDEISQTWIEFSKTVVDDLLSVVKLTKS
ncbi:MAG: hypothetical protein ACW98K_14060, partial [Candidatus Kariarchaeaceae archaeon]